MAMDESAEGVKVGDGEMEEGWGMMKGMGMGNDHP